MIYKFKGIDEANFLQRVALFFVKPMWIKYSMSPGHLKVKLLGGVFFIIEDKTETYGRS